jgi:hypothetical protein
MSLTWLGVISGHIAAQWKTTSFSGRYGSLKRLRKMAECNEERGWVCSEKIQLFSSKKGEHKFG